MCKDACTHISDSEREGGTHTYYVLETPKDSRRISVEYNSDSLRLGSGWKPGDGGISFTAHLCSQRAVVAVVASPWLGITLSVLSLTM